MKTNIQMNCLNGRYSKVATKTTMLGAAVTAALLAANPAQAADNDHTPHVGDIFVIALENHNLTQPVPTNEPQQILGNPAAPFINSLMTPGNANAAQVSYATAYFNDGIGVHPSEPNYVWAEAGSDFGFHSDADPNPLNGNKFYDTTPHLASQVTADGNTLVFWHKTITPHLTGQLNAAGIPWKNYQEDVELSASPTNSASGTNGPVNPYNGTTQYNYAVKHNPMGFFDDSDDVNVYPLAQLFSDLNSDTVGRYNWITPDQYNEAHSALNDGFTYQGVHYTGDQSAIAAADSFLSIVLPQIMSSKAYKDNGVIILWWDESEGGDNTSFTLPEIIISPLAKGNAYASAVPMNHSSDLKTMEEIFGLSLVNNPIPASETNSDGNFNNVATVNDLSDMFVAGAIPAPLDLTVTAHKLVIAHHDQHASQTVEIKNTGTSTVVGPLFLVLDNLSSNATLLNQSGTTAVLAPLGSPYVKINLGPDNVLHPHQAATVTLDFLDPGDGAIDYSTRALAVTPAP
jgi:phosphatidylinositol-3-phosphatase